MNFDRLIKSIFGYFWTDLWNDSWLILGLLSVYSKYIYPISTQKLQNMYKQTSVRCVNLTNLVFPKRVMLDKNSKKHAIKKLEQLYIGNTESSGYIGLSDSSLFIYDIKQLFLTPVRLKNNIINLTYSTDDFFVLGTQLITPVDLSLKNIKQTIFILDDKPSVCYQLWGDILNKAPVMDAFSAIAQVPKSWITEYPGAVLDAWYIRQFGATPFRLKSLIGRVCLCPVAQLDGSVTAIVDNIVYINLQPYKCWNKDAILVGVGQHVHKGEALCSFSVYNNNAVVLLYVGLTPLRTQLPRIPVLTSVGILYALNKDYTIVNNILPLTSDNPQLIYKYTQICRLNTLAGLPHTQLPAVVNPMKYLILNVWGKSCVIVIIPSRNKLALLKAFSCVIDNMPVGAICIAYKLDILLLPVLLNLTLKSLVLAYYQSSVNNGMLKEMVYGVD